MQLTTTQLANLHLLLEQVGPTNILHALASGCLKRADWHIARLREVEGKPGSQQSQAEGAHRCANEWARGAGKLYALADEMRGLV